MGEELTGHPRSSPSMISKRFKMPQMLCKRHTGSSTWRVRPTLGALQLVCELKTPPRRLFGAWQRPTKRWHLTSTSQDEKESCH